LGYLIIFITSFLVFLAMNFLSFDGGDGDVSDPGDDPGADVADLADGGDDLDVTEPSSSSGGLFQYLTFRNCINFLIGFGAAGYLAQRAELHPALAANCGLLGGTVSAVLMYKLMAAFHQLSEEQLADGREALGQLGRVYIEIGANRSCRGKVLVTVMSAQREYPAVTDSPSPLKLNSMVRILDYEGGCFVVAPAEE